MEKSNNPECDLCEYFPSCSIYRKAKERIESLEDYLHIEKANEIAKYCMDHTLSSISKEKIINYNKRK